VIYWLMRSLFRLLFRYYGSWEVRGHEHVPKTGPVLIAPNHLSFLDPPLMGCALERPGWFMAKAELFRVPGFRWLITKMHAYPVKRGVADRAAMKRTLDYLRNGEVVCVFPEGKRSIDGTLGQIEIGIGLLAVKTGAVIVPAAIRGTDKMLPRSGKRLYPAKIRVQFAPPIPVPGGIEGRAEREVCQALADQVRDSLLAVLEEMDRRALADTPDGSQPAKPPEALGGHRGE
jgi:1-acyl-sn-glycerol-3-phosphate acyltransferase